MYGIDENPPNTKRHARLKNDIKAFHDALVSASIQIEPSAIKDCFRLGQYKSGSDHPRPLLIKFLRSTDATYLLTSKTQLKHPIYIKPDVTPLEKSNESLLLKERKTLIQKGTDRQHIKLRNSHLYVNDQLFAKAENGQLCYCSRPPPRSNTTSIDVDMAAATDDNLNNRSQDKPSVFIPVVSNDTLPMSTPGSDCTVHSVQSHPSTSSLVSVERNVPTTNLPNEAAPLSAPNSDSTIAPASASSDNQCR